jgi:hypothetical protein
MNKPLSTKDRKAIAREYKESYRPTGVYRLRNTVNGKVLVGSSVNLPAIFNRLRMQLDAGTHPMYPELQRDWKALGAAAFEFEVLQELEPPEGPGWDPREDLAALEALWLEELSPYGEKGYNRRPKGS